MRLIEEARFYVNGEYVGSYRQGVEQDIEDYEDEIWASASYISRENHGAQVTVMRSKEVIA